MAIRVRRVAPALLGILYVILYVGSGSSPRVRSGFSRIGLAQMTVLAQSPDAPLPELTQPVHDLADVIDPASEAELERMSRALLAASGDAMVVVTVPSYEGYADVREYAVKLFENHGRGIGDRAKDNGILIVLAMRERAVWVEVGYDLEEWITDGFAGETSREEMVPEFRNGQYGAGLVRGATRIVARIAEGRGITLEGVEAQPARDRVGPQLGLTEILIIFALIVIISRIAGGPGQRKRRRGWSGWSSGAGPFGGMGGWGGGGWTGGGGGVGGGGWSRGGGGGFGGGFGGFGGGRSGGGGGGARW